MITWLRKAGDMLIETMFWAAVVVTALLIPMAAYCAYIDYLEFAG